MRNIEEIKEIINKNRLFLERKFKVKSISVFGSYLRNKQNEESDIDILVEFYDTIDLFEFIALENFLSEKIGNKVDLVMKDVLKPRIKNRILEEAISV